MIQLLYLICLIFIILGAIKYRELFNPLTLFNSIWFITIFLYEFKLSFLQNNLQPETIRVFLVMAIVFNLAYIYIALIFKVTHRKNHLCINKISNRFNLDISRKNIMKIFRVWIIIEIIEIIFSGGFPLMWKMLNIPKTYFDFGINSIHGFANAFALVIILIAYTYIHKVDSKDKGIRNIIIFIMIAYVAFLSRQVIISAAIEIIILRNLFLKEKRKKIGYYKYIIIALIGIVAFGILGNIRTGYDGFYNVAMMKKKLPTALTGFHWVYMYLTMTVANIDFMAIMNLGNTANGVVASTFIPSIIRNLFFETSLIDMNLYLLTPAFNVAGFFREFYIDSGLLGVATICSLYGGMGGWIYNKYINSRTNQNAMYYAVYSQIILLSFFYNQLLYLPSGFQFVMIFLVVIYFKSKTKEIN